MSSDFQILLQVCQNLPSCETVVAKWSPSGRQVVAKWSPSGRQVVAKWSPSGHQMVTKWSVNSGCDKLSENIWFAWSNSCNKGEKVRCQACDGHTHRQANNFVSSGHICTTFWYSQTKNVNPRFKTMSKSFNLYKS